MSTAEPIVVFYDLGHENIYGVKYTVHPNGYSVAFEARGVQGYDENGPIWWKDGASTLDDADVFVSGDVRWDGCTNYETDRDCMAHACSRESLVALGVLLGRIFDQSAALMTTVLDDIGARPVVEDVMPWQRPRIDAPG